MYKIMWLSKFLTFFMMLSFMLIVVWLFLINVPPSTFLGFSKQRSAPVWLTSLPISHRGLHDSEMIPENSLAAFQNAVEHNFAIELDVQLTKDGHLVVFHDHDLERMTGKEGRIQDLNLADIKHLTLLNTDQRIPLLSQALETISGKVPMLIEVKVSGENDPKSIAEKVYEQVEDYKGHFAIISFNPLILEWFRKNAPDIYRGQTSGAYDTQEKIQSADGNATAYRNYLANWRSQPEFIVHDHTDMDRFPVSFLKKFKTLIIYGVNSKTHLDTSRSQAHNIIFENLKDELRAERYSGHPFERS